MGSAARGAAKGRARVLGGTQGSRGVGTSAQELAHKCSKMPCWLVAPAHWAPGRHLGGQGGGISIYQPWKGGQGACESGRLHTLPTRWGWRHCRARRSSPRCARREHPCSPFAPCLLWVGAVLAGCHSLALLGGSGLTGSRFSGRCCRTARRPAGKWSCTGEHRSARTSSASWTSTRTSTRGGSVCSSSWSGESPVVPRQVGSPHRTTCSPAGRC